MSRKTRQDIRNAKHEYKEAKSNLKATKKQPPKEGFSKEDQKNEITVLKNEKKRLKSKKRQAIQRNGGRPVQKIARGIHNQGSHFVNSSFQDNDVLEDVATGRQKFRKANADIRQAKRMSKYTLNINKKATKGLYGLSNRSYNLARGRGFTRTPISERWETKVSNRYQRLRVRMRSSKFGKTANGARKVTRKVGKSVLTILKNPLTSKAYLIMFLGFVSIAFLALIMGGGSSTVSQNEFDLTDTWVYLSKIDREKSNDKVDYWTNIDDIMMFMGYKYQDYTLDQKYDKKDKKWYQVKHTYKDLLSDLWQDLNGDKDNLKSMADVYTKTDNKYLKLNKDEIKDYDEILTQAKEVGYYINYNDLDNPFNNQNNDDSVPSITITKRFGYVSKTKMYNGSILQANRGDTLYAVMAGKVTIKNSDVIIKNQDSEFTYKNVSSLRIKTGDKVKSGQEIGVVGSGNGQEVYYRKLKNKKKNEWAWVNVGFYLPKVEYSQTTSVMTDMNIKGNMAKKITSIYDYLKKQDSHVTQNGVAAALGNFWTESSINPKRSEGDYLKPPVGASSSSWDDSNWLNMGGTAIYGAGYSNILHRGLGLGQWTDTADGSRRHTMLLNYAKSKNKKWYDLELQLDFMLKGDSPYYTTVLKKILQSKEDVSALTKRFLTQWEGNPGDKIKERQNNAQQVLQYLKNPTSGGTKGGSSSLQNSWNFPKAYQSKLKTYPSSKTVTSSLGGNTYPVGQCTWYVYNRLVEAGAPHYNGLGNGQDWVRSLVSRGWKFSDTPVAGAVCSTAGGFDFTMAAYGHVSYVEYVNSDGTFLVSECNYAGVQNKIHWGVKTNASYYTFAIPPK